MEMTFFFENHQIQRIFPSKESILKDLAPLFKQHFKYGFHLAGCAVHCVIVNIYLMNSFDYNIFSKECITK